MKIAVAYFCTSTTKEAPSTLLEKVVWTFVDGLHDRTPIQVNGSLAHGNINGTKEDEDLGNAAREENDSLEPIFHIIKLRAWYRVDVKRWLREILEHKHRIKLFKGELDTLERCNFDIGESDHEKWWLNEVDKTLGGRLQPHVGAERNTVER